MELHIPRIAVVGSGYWGRNLVRNFQQLGALRVVCDTREEPVQEARAQYGVRTTSDVDSVLNDKEIDGVVIAAILFLLEEMPIRVSAHGGSYVDPRTVDTTLTTCQFASGVQAHIFVSWLHPFKEQKLAVVGSKKMAVFDDVQREHKLVLYSHRIDWLDRTPVAHKADGEVVELPPCEPLRLECEHFLHCIRTRGVPRTSGASALRVLEVLEACEQSLRAEGAMVPIGVVAPGYYAHPTAVIDKGAQIGESSRIWHFSHIMPDSKMGTNCNLGQNVVVSPHVKIGNNVKIQNNVSLYTGVELED